MFNFPSPLPEWSQERLRLQEKLKAPVIALQLCILQPHAQQLLFFPLILRRCLEMPLWEDVSRSLSDISALPDWRLLVLVTPPIEASSIVRAYVGVGRLFTSPPLWEAKGAIFKSLLLLLIFICSCYSAPGKYSH